MIKKVLSNKYVKAGITILLVIIIAICFYYILFHNASLRANLKVVGDILMPIILGLALGYLLVPLLNFIENRILHPLCERCHIKPSLRRERIVRGIGLLLTGCLFFLIIYTLCYMLLSQIIPSVIQIITNFELYVDNFTEWLNDLFIKYPAIQQLLTENIEKYSNQLENWMDETLLSLSSEVIKAVSLSVVNILSVLLDFILGFIISIYVMATKESFCAQAKKILYAFFQHDTANIILNNFRFAHKTFIGFLGGKVIDSIIMGILCFIGTSLMNTPYAMLVSIVIGVTNVIPFFGPFIGAIPCAILILVVDPTHPLNCIYFAIFILALQQFDGNILGPKILGNSTGIKSFWVIFAITFFGGLWGVIGMIVGVPIFAIIYATVKSIVNSALRKRNLPEDTSLYGDIGMVDEAGFHKYAFDSSGKENITAEEPDDFAHVCDGERIYSCAEDIQIDLEMARKRHAAATEQQSNDSTDSEASGQ